MSNFWNKTTTTTAVQIRQADWHQIGQNLPVGQPKREPVRQQPYAAPPQRQQRPQMEYVVGMKLVCVVRGPSGDKRYFSMYDNTEYRIGEALKQLALPDHRGGYYMYATTSPLQIIQELNNGTLADTGGGEYAVMECQGYGPYVAYDGYGRTVPMNQPDQIKKISCSILLPVWEHGTFNFPGNIPHRITPSPAYVTISQRGRAW